MDSESESDGVDWLDLLKQHAVVVILVAFGIGAVGFGGVMLILPDETSVEIISSESSESEREVVVEVSGAVGSPGVFSVKEGTRIDEVLSVAGGLTGDADRHWVEKILNRASVISDGQKIYIPSLSEQSKVSSANEFSGDQTVSGGNSAENVISVNINSASQGDLEALWGIGQVTAQNIIDQRPYSTIEELVTRKIIKENVFEKNRELLTVY